MSSSKWCPLLLGVNVLGYQYLRHLIILGPVSISEKTSFRKISSSLEAAIFVFRIVRSLWNLTGTSAAVLPMCLSNFKTIRQFKVTISRLRGFTRSYERATFRILRRGPDHVFMYPSRHRFCEYSYLGCWPLATKYSFEYSAVWIVINSRCRRSIIYACIHMLYNRICTRTYHNYQDEVTKWKHFPRYWPFVRGIHRSPLMFSSTCAWINGWVKNRDAADLKRHCPHYDVNVRIFANDNPLCSRKCETWVCSTHGVSSIKHPVPYLWDPTTSTAGNAYSWFRTLPSPRPCRGSLSLTWNNFYPGMDE